MAARLAHPRSLVRLTTCLRAPRSPPTSRTTCGSPSCGSPDGAPAARRPRPPARPALARWPRSTGMGPLTPGALAQHEQVRPPSMTQGARQPARGGPRRPRRRPDRRPLSRSCRSPPKARRLLREDRRRRDEWLAALLLGLDPDEPRPARRRAARAGGARRLVTPMFRALSVRNYRLYFTGQVLSNTGTWMQRVAQDWLVLDALRRFRRRPRHHHRPAVPAVPVLLAVGRHARRPVQPPASC